MQDPQCQIPTAFLFILVWNKRKKKCHSPSAENAKQETSASHHSTPISQVKTRKGQTTLLLKFCRHFWNTFPFRHELGHFWRHHQNFSLFWRRKIVRSYLGHNNWYSHLVWCTCNITVPRTPGASPACSTQTSKQHLKTEWGVWNSLPHAGIHHLAEVTAGLPRVMPDLGSSADKTINILTSYVKGSKLKANKNTTTTQSKKRLHDENIFRFPATSKILTLQISIKKSVQSISWWAFQTVKN